jgi:ATP/maltotriose-dependent transcriptional regulator MalT
MAQRFEQKLVVPVATFPLVDRSGLVQRLEQTIRSKRVVTLVAPAGWGKTTALIQWAEGTSLPVCWYTLDSADRDPWLFLDYLLHALRSVLPEAAALAERLDSASPAALPELYRATALAIAAAPASFALILDDLHTLEAGIQDVLPGTGLIFELIASVAAYAEPCQLVLASRALPSFQGLARLAVQQRALAFDYTALQFTGADVQRLAFVSQQVMLPAHAAEEIARRFDGWIVGISLMLQQSAQSSPDPLRWEPDEVEEVYAFFAEQTLALLPPELSAFLEDTSVLDDLSPHRCNALRGAMNSAPLLEEARRHGLFVSRRAGWLSLHSLFREFLRERLRDDPLRERLLLERAAELYRDEDDLERAVGAYMAAGKPNQAIELLREAIPRYRQRSRQTTLLACFDQLQASTAQRRPLGLLPADLYVAQARIYADLEVWDRTAASLQIANTVGTPEIRWEAQLSNAEFRCFQGDYGEAQRILNALPVASLPPRLQLMYHYTAGRVYVRSGELKAAIKALEHAHATALSSEYASQEPALLATIYDLLGWAYAVQGSWSLGAEHLRRADAFWQISGNAARRALTLNNLGMFAINEGRYQDAEFAFTTGLALAEETSQRREEALTLCSLAELNTLRGELDTALDRFRQAHSLAQRLSVPTIMAAAAVGGLWAAALQGDEATAESWRASIPAEPNLEPAVAGRQLLAERLLRDRAGNQWREANPALAAIETPEVLSVPERAFLWLLQAGAAFERDGWEGAAALWREFAQLAPQVAEPLLNAFAETNRPLLEAATGSSPLAQELLARLSRSSGYRWRITALGGFSCSVDNTPCELSPLHRALLVRLLDAGAQGLPIERLWESVWGDSELSMAALHQALRRLRMFTQLAISTREGTCAIYSPWEQINYDVQALEGLLARQLSLDCLKQVTSLYRGPFLESAPASAALWADARRAQLEQRYLDTLEQLALTLEAAAPHQAIDSYQQILQIDPCREYTASQLMRLAAHFGNHTLIITTFEHLLAALRTINAEPAPTTVALYRRLVTANSA